MRWQFLTRSWKRSCSHRNKISSRTGSGIAIASQVGSCECVMEDLRFQPGPCVSVRVATLPSTIPELSTDYPRGSMSAFRECQANRDRFAGHRARRYRVGSSTGATLQELAEAQM